MNGADKNDRNPRGHQPRRTQPQRVATLVIIQSIVALIGWVYIYVSASWLSIGLSPGWIAVDTIAYLAYARAEHTWPFVPKQINEAFTRRDLRR